MIELLLLDLGFLENTKVCNNILAGTYILPALINKYLKAFIKALAKLNDLTYIPSMVVSTNSLD